MGLNTSKFSMKHGLAWMMAFALLNVITACPVLAHGIPVSHSCCEHSQGQPLPCTDTASNACPYVLLEKSKVESGLLGLIIPAFSGIVDEPIHPVEWFSSLASVERRADASSSYLLFRVLLI